MTLLKLVILTLLLLLKYTYRQKYRLMDKGWYVSITYMTLNTLANKGLVTQGNIDYTQYSTMCVFLLNKWYTTLLYVMKNITINDMNVLLYFCVLGTDIIITSYNLW